ncbi:MAG: hypothetical protein ACKVP3_22245 [Hyphomicrobiaceae bacterium]
MVKVTPAVSVSFFKSEFNDFLYAPIGADRHEMPLSVLSALTRLNLDPWKEAAELSELPKDTATQRLATLIARLPGGRWTPADSGSIADRLIELLPHRRRSKAAENAQGLLGLSGSAVVKTLVCAALVIALIIAASREPSSRGDHADAPVFSTASPPQTSSPSFRQ